MTKRTKISKWGNSLGVRIPKTMLKEVGLDINDKVNIEVKNGCIALITPSKKQTLAERLEQFYGKPLSEIYVESNTEEYM